MTTLRDHGMTEASLDNTVNPETLNDEISTIVTYPDGRVFEIESDLIFAPDNAPVFWREATLDELLAGEVIGWEPDENTTVTRLG